MAEDPRPGATHYAAGDVVRLCTLPGCTWTYVEPSPFPVVTAGADDIDDAVNRAFAARVDVVETAIRGHAETHTALEYLTAVATLRQALGTADPGHPLLAVTSPAIIPGLRHLKFM